MNIIPWRKRHFVPVNPEAKTTMHHFRREMDRLFDRFLDRFPHHGTWPEPSDWTDDPDRPQGMLVPSVDIAENEKQITIHAEVPGLGPDDFEISVSGNVLTIRGEKRECTEDKSADHYHCERRFGSFTRSIELPADADLESIEAEERHGVLTVAVRKIASAEHKPKKIGVKVTGEKLVSSH